MMNAFLLNHAVWCDLLLFVLTQFVWQALLIVLLAGAIAKCLHRERTSVRYGIYVCALLAIIVCPVVTASFFSDSDLSTVQSTPTSSVATTSEPQTVAADRNEWASTRAVDELPGFAEAPSADVRFDNTTDTVAPAVGQTVAPTATAGDVPTFFPSSRFRVAGAYVLGVTFMLLRLLVSLASARNLRSSTFAIDDADLLDQVARQVKRLRLRAAPLTRLSQLVVVPTIVGIFRPMILLPVTLITELTSDQLAAIVAHELAHIRRLDPLMNLLQRTTEVVFFFHPAVWLLSRWLTHERELACDELVVSSGEPALCYAETLLRVAELGYQGKSAPHVNELLTLNAVRGNSTLELRVRRLLGIPAAERFRVRRGSIVSVVISLVLAVTCSLLWANAPNSRILENSGSQATIETAASTSEDDVAAASKSRGTNPGELHSRPRHFVRLVIGSDRMTFQGKDTSWDQLETLLSELNGPEHTVLEIGDRDEAPGGPFGFVFANAFRHMGSRAHRLAVRNGLESISTVGKSEFDAKGSPTQTVKVDVESEQRIAAAIEMVRPLHSRSTIQVREVARTGKVFVADIEIEPRGLLRILRAIPGREAKTLEVVYVGKAVLSDSDVERLKLISGLDLLGFKACKVLSEAEPQEPPVVGPPARDKKTPGSAPSSKLSAALKGAGSEATDPSDRDSGLAPPPELTPQELVNGFLDRLVEGEKRSTGSTAAGAMRGHTRLVRTDGDSKCRSSPVGQRSERQFIWPARLARWC